MPNITALITFFQLFRSASLNGTSSGTCYGVSAWVVRIWKGGKVKHPGWTCFVILFRLKGSKNPDACSTDAWSSLCYVILTRTLCSKQCLKKSPDDATMLLNSSVSVTLQCCYRIPLWLVAMIGECTLLFLSWTGISVRNKLVCFNASNAVWSLERRRSTYVYNKY